MSYRLPKVVYLRSRQEIYNDEQERISCKEFKQPEPKAPKGRPNPMVIARGWLDKRLVEKSSGYFLDGVPANLTTIMRATNQLLVDHGAQQLGPENWRV